MHCPNCAHPNYDLLQSCPACHFSGDPLFIEELDRIEWLLAEIDQWEPGLGVSPENLNLIRQKYTARRRELEITLNLRLPPFTLEEARLAWPQLFQREALLQKMGEWLAAGQIDPLSTQALVDQTSQQVEDLLEQLEGQPRPGYPQTEADRLGTTNFLLDAATRLGQNHSFTSPAAEAQILASLRVEKEQLEISLSPRPTPEPVNQPAGAPLQKH
ncbi:MAG: hypothetical protein HC875_37660, partial [Anaerolineales bacterium]|nr:hypothetical protein [Anaerolineales bacterium]